MSGMDGLVTWLRAQLDEDERVAREADGFYDDRDLAAELVQVGFDREVAILAARWDPARVLAEVDAKRRILDEIVDEINSLDVSLDIERRVGTRDMAAEPYVGDQLVRLLALPYANRPGYRDEWRP